MPATSIRLDSPLGLPARLLIGIIVVGLLASLGALTPAPAEARNWTGEISATRASQLYYEGLMRSADAELRSLTQARKQTQRTIRQAQRNLRTAAARRVEAKRELREVRNRLRLARLALAASAFPPPPPPDAASAVLALTPASETDTSAVDASGLDGSLTGALPPMPTLLVQRDEPDRSPLAVSAAGGSHKLQADVSVGDVVALTREEAKQQRKFQGARQRALRVWRYVRVKRNNLAAIKARERSTMGRRAGAEAALGGRILSMSALAQRRVAKKTNVRPGVNSGFTWPTQGRISQRYGCTGFALNPARGSCRHFHDGLDIAGYRGTAIRAAAVGVVSYIGWNPWDRQGRAFMIVVAHPGGYETLYGHVLPARQVRVGQVVKRGEVIGFMGNTGRSTGVHLHFELRRGRTTLDPLAFL